MSYPKFSVAMSVYKNDRAEWVDLSIQSILNQTAPSDEIVLIVDGPVPTELDNVIKKYEDCPQFNVIRFAKNKGLGKALNEAVLKAKNEIIARMDSDDIAMPDRFERQLKLFAEDEELSLCGGSITEFIGSPENSVGVRAVFEKNEDIYNDLKKRCPFNHMTVMFKKQAVLNVGNYIDWHYNEDYYLWIRMAEKGLKFANITDTLVNVRVGKEMYARRGGYKYFKSEAGLQNYMLKHKVIGFGTYAINITKRFIVQVMLPNKLRGWVFKTFAREK